MAEALADVATGLMPPPPPERQPRRDAAVEEEIFHRGIFADVVFKCRGGKAVPEEVYGQASIYAMVSPVLRDLLRRAPPDQPPPEMVPQVAVKNIATSDSHGLREVWLDDAIDVEGFREVARYAYGLRQVFRQEIVPEVLAAASALEVEELEEAALSWGLAYLQTTQIASSGGDEVEQLSDVAEALRCLAQLCIDAQQLSERSADSAVQRRKRQAVTVWVHTVLEAHGVAEVLACPMMLQLPPSAFEVIFDEVIHEDTLQLWALCIRWAKACSEREALPERSTPREGAKPRKLFRPGARLLAMAPARPPESETEWQRWLLPFAPKLRLAQLEPATFLTHVVEAIDPMLPELRQVIYATRRQHLREHSGSDTASRFDEVLQ